MAFEILERKVVKHRNGTSTSWVKYRVPTEQIALQFAIASKCVSRGSIVFPGNMTWKLVKEDHGSRTYTRMRIHRIIGNETHLLCSGTKSELGQLFNVQFSEMDERTSVYWEANRPDLTFAEDGIIPSSVEDALQRIVDRAVSYDLTELEVKSIQEAAIAHDEFDIAAAIDQRNQIETYAALKAYLEARGNHELVMTCGILQFYPNDPIC